MNNALNHLHGEAPLSCVGRTLIGPLLKRYSSLLWRRMARSTWLHVHTNFHIDSIAPSRASHWPETFYVRVVHERPVLRDIKAWIKECVPPLPICTFMPIRLREQNANAVNQSNFRSLSRILFENQVVCLS
jgi:hypothetical protein